MLKKDKALREFEKDYFQVKASKLCPNGYIVLNGEIKQILFSLTEIFAVDSVGVSNYSVKQLCEKDPLFSRLWMKHSSNIGDWLIS